VKCNLTSRLPASGSNPLTAPLTPSGLTVSKKYLINSTGAAVAGGAGFGRGSPGGGIKERLVRKKIATINKLTAAVKSQCLPLLGIHAADLKASDGSTDCPGASP